MPKSAADWVADGKVDAAPVTSSTPEVTPAAAPDAAAPTPAVDTAPAAAPSAPAAAPAGTIAERAKAWANQPRDDAGKFAPKDAGAAPADPAAAPAAAAAAPVGESVAEQVQAQIEELEARLNGQPYKVPLGAEIPLKRGNDVEYVTLAELQKRGMLEKDYRQKTTAHAEQVRLFEQEKAVEAARQQAVQEYLQEQTELAEKARLDPEAEAVYLQHQEMYRNVPWYKKTVDDALMGRIRAAEDNVLAERAQAEMMVSTAQELYNDIKSMATEYPGVDPEIVRVAYSRDLQDERVPLGREAIKQYYEREKARLDAVRQPINAELETLKRELAALKAASAQQTHNAKTRQQIDRTLNPIAAPAGGAPVGQPGKPQITGKSMTERARSWGKVR